MREVDHGRDLSVVNTSLVQFGVDVLGNPVGRPTPPEIVADDPCHPDDGGFVAVRPREAHRAQLSKLAVINGIGSRNRSAGNQGSANHRGDGQCRQPTR